MTDIRQEVLFDAAVHDGAVDIRHQSLIDRLLRTGDYEIALEQYGVRFDEHGVQIDDAVPADPKGKAKGKK